MTRSIHICVDCLFIERCETMFKKGEYMIYSFHGVCFVDDIEEKIIDKIKQTYYILQPFNQPNSTIMTPIDNTKVKMRSIMTPEESEKILQGFANQDVPRIADNKPRDQHYIKLAKEGEPQDMVDIINALVIEEQERIADKKKLSATDMKHLEKAKQLLYPELAVSLGVEVEDIDKRVEQIFEAADLIELDI